MEILLIGCIGGPMQRQTDQQILLGIQGIPALVVA